MTLDKLAFWKSSGSKKAKVNNGQGGARKFFSQLSGAFMLPISVMAVAGLFLGIGAAIWSHTSGGASTFGLFIKNWGDPVFGAMPILFTMAMIIAFTDDIGTAVFAGIVGFLVFNAVQTPFITKHDNPDGSTGTVEFFNMHISDQFGQMAYQSVGFVAGIPALNTSIFAGIVYGYIAARMYNKFHTIVLPSWVSFFGGKRFVSFVNIACAIPLAIVFLLLWPFVAAGLGYFGKYSGRVFGLDSLIFGFAERSLVPFGLHHVFYAPLWYTAAGGDAVSAINNWSKDANHVITAINGGQINVITANIDLAKSALNSIVGTALKDTVNNNPIFADQHAVIVASGQTIAGLKYLSNNEIDWSSVNSDAMAQQVNSAINAAIDQKIQDFKTLNIASSDLAKLAGAEITNVTSLNSVLANKIKISNGGNYLGDSFGWLAISGSGVNTVTYSLTGAAGTTRELPIFEFLGKGSLSDGFTGPLGDDSINFGRFMQGKFSFMQFGLPAAGAAMIMAAPKENRKVALGTVLPACLTSFVTGVTEPIEFTFLFLAPWLFWGFHAAMASISFLLMNLLHAHVGMTFSGGFLDAIIYGAIPFSTGTNFYWYFAIGVVYVPIYYFAFLFFIKKFNLDTPGRGGNTKLFTKADFRAQQDGAAAAQKGALTAQAAAVVKAYGGWDNITAFKNCATRLRYDVKDGSKVSIEALKAAGAAGVMKMSDNHFQAIMGPQAEQINTNIKSNMGADLGDGASKAAAKEVPATAQPTHKIHDAVVSVEKKVTSKVTKKPTTKKGK